MEGFCSKMDFSISEAEIWPLICLFLFAMCLNATPEVLLPLPTIRSWRKTFCCQHLGVCVCFPLVEMIKESHEGWWFSKTLIKFSLTHCFFQLR